MEEIKFLFTDGKEESISTGVKPVIIRKATEWKLYTELFDASLMNKFKLAITRHLGIPTKFPVIVWSITDHTVRTVEHKFIYVDEARLLIDLDKKINNRLNYIIQEQNDSND